MKNTKKLLSLLLVIAMIFALAVPAFAEGETPSMAGKTVIVHSNDVHGAIAGYANIAALAAERGQDDERGRLRRRHPRQPRV